MVSIVNFSTRSGYKTFIKQNDLNISLSLAEQLADYYRINNSWEGVESFGQIPQLRFSQMKNMMSRNDNNSPRYRNMVPHLVLTNKKGSILINTNPEDNLNSENLQNGIEITVNGQVEGYVYAGSMLHKGLSENEEGFLDRITFIIIGVSFFILIISIIFSTFFSWRITKPLTALTLAAHDIESGNFKRRVPRKGRDELAELTGSFNKMADSLENNDKWRKQIIADSAHELRTPVSLIQGNLEMILDGVYEADKKHLQNIYDETLVLSRLIQELQLLSSAESGSMSLNREDIDLNILIENVLNIFHAGEVKDNIVLNNSVDVKFPLLLGDYQKLKQVLSNVLANAFRHTPEGGTVTVRGKILEDAAQIIIEDTGPGIREDDLEKIFERFYRTDSSRNRNHGGSGLGLSISREILRLHGGSIMASSLPGKGATFYISIPFKI
jgi:signal transduction histidine kinase